MPHPAEPEPRQPLPLQLRTRGPRHVRRGGPGDARRHAGRRRRQHPGLPVDLLGGRAADDPGPAEVGPVAVHPEAHVGPDQVARLQRSAGAAPPRTGRTRRARRSCRSSRASSRPATHRPPPGPPPRSPGRGPPPAAPARGRAKAAANPADDAAHAQRSRSSSHADLTARTRCTTAIPSASALPLGSAARSASSVARDIPIRPSPPDSMPARRAWPRSPASCADRLLRERAVRLHACPAAGRRRRRRDEVGHERAPGHRPAARPPRGRAWATTRARPPRTRR